MTTMLKNIVRVGKVSSIQPEKCTARVVFEDLDDLTSYELPIIVRGSLETKEYWMPKPDEQVVCLFLPSGNAQGFIIGSFYSQKDTPPVQDPNKRHLSFSDGTCLEYDQKTSTLTINAKGPVKIIAAENVIVQGDVIADGISLKEHVHIEPGGGTTGSPAGGS